MVAAFWGKDIAVEELLQPPFLAATNTTSDLSKDGKQALHYAAEEGHLDSLQLLLKFGAYTEFRDNWGNTPLHYASMNNHFECAKKLLIYGARVTPMNKDCNMPGAVAHNREMATLLNSRILVKV